MTFDVHALLTDNPKSSRTMNSCFHLIFGGLGSHRTAPHLSEIDEEQLLVGHIQSSHMLSLHAVRRLTIFPQPFLVCTKRLFDAAIVGDIFSLRYRPIDGQIINFTHAIAAILRYQTIGSLVESFDCTFAPPAIQIAITIE